VTTAAARRRAQREAARLTHLLRRTTYGLTPALVAEATKQGRTAWLEAQLAPAKLRDPEGAAVLARFPNLSLSALEYRRRVDAGQANSWDAMFDLGQAALGRAAWSRRQLLEVMHDFWSNHFNVTCPSDEVWDTRHGYDAVLRAGALGRFADLLAAAVRHPAMLRYLGADTSTKRAPNENLGRELLELHTVGIEAGYTERDVLDSARILTGLTIDWSTVTTTFRPRDHWTGPVRVLDFSAANDAADGQGVLAAYLAHLARHPATARRLARRLAVRFVADDPPKALVDRLAAVYLANDTAIVPVLRTLFAAPEFFAAPDAKVRRPMEAAVATLRALGMRQAATGVAELEGLYWALESQDHRPYAWPQPDGYPDRAEAWASSAGVLARWNITLGIAAEWWPKGFTHAPLRSLVPRRLPATHGALVAGLGQRLLQRPLPPAHVAAICGFLGKRTSSPLRADSEAVGWRLPYVVALVLDSPVHVLR
jgi:uncharacterized protein (DUF1800 family)